MVDNADDGYIINYMVEYSMSTLDLTLRALADPTRRAMLTRISQGECTVSELAEPFDMSLAAASKHIQVLERAKFVEKYKAGRVITCRATLSPLAEVMELLEELGRYWNRQLDSLEEYLASEDKKKGANNGKKTKRNTTSVSDSTYDTRKKR